VQDSSESAGGGLFETYEDCSTASYSYVVRFRVDNKGSDGTGCFRIKLESDKGDVIRESKIFIKDKTKVACKMSGIKRRVIYFRKMLFQYR